MHGEVKVGDEIFSLYEQNVTVDSVTPQEELSTTYNIASVNDTDTYFENGVLVHNMFKK